MRRNASEASISTNLDSTSRAAFISTIEATLSTVSHAPVYYCSNELNCTHKALGITSHTEKSKKYFE